MTELVNYEWHYDAPYYVTVIHRYYQQLPFLLQLPTQFGILWLMGVAVFSTLTAGLSVQFVLWAILVGAITIPIGTSVTKKAILLKYRVRPSFNSKCTYTISEAGITIESKLVRGIFEWSEYNRAVRFPDGILLLRKDVTRWLPDSAIVGGTPADATELVRARLPMRYRE